MIVPVWMYSNHCVTRCFYTTVADNQTRQLEPRQLQSFQAQNFGTTGRRQVRLTRKRFFQDFTDKIPSGQNFSEIQCNIKTAR